VVRAVRRGCEKRRSVVDASALCVDNDPICGGLRRDEGGGTPPPMGGGTPWGPCALESLEPVRLGGGSGKTRYQAADLMLRPPCPLGRGTFSSGVSGALCAPEGGSGMANCLMPLLRVIFTWWRRFARLGGAPIEGCYYFRRVVWGALRWRDRWDGPVLDFDVAVSGAYAHVKCSGEES